MRPAAIFLLFMAMGCSFQGKATLETPKLESGRDSTGPRIDEDGSYATFKLVLEGCVGREVPIRMFDKDRHQLMGESLARASYEVTEWSTFRVFVPRGEEYKVQDKASVGLYAVSPEDPSAFLGACDLTWQRGSGPGFAWADVRHADDVALPGGGEGFEISGVLYVRGYKGQETSIVLLVREPGGGEVRGPDGAPLRIEGGGLTLPYDDCIFKEGALVMHVPYESVKHLPPNRELVVTPALRIGGQLYDGNVHVQFWAGGSPDRRAKLLEQELHDLDAQIDSLEREVRALGAADPKGGAQ